MDDTTYVLGYWNIEENVKRSVEHYKHFMPRTLKMLGASKMVFFCNEDYWEDYFNNHVKSKNISVIRIEIEELPTFELSKYYLQSCKNQKLETKYWRERGIQHYSREYKQSGEESYLKVFSVWTSKIGLIKKVIEVDPLQSNRFAWVDVSLSRMNGKRNNWNFMSSNYNDNYIYHYNSKSKYLGVPISTSAGFLYGYKDMWKELILLYEDQIEKQKNSNYAHDEETLLEIIYRENKDLFFNISSL